MKINVRQQFIKENILRCKTNTLPSSLQLARWLGRRYRVSLRSHMQFQREPKHVQLSDKEKAEEMLKSELKRGVRKGKITARQGEAIVNNRRSSRHKNDAADLVELDEHDEVRISSKQSRNRTRKSKSASKSSCQILSQPAQTSKSAPRKRVTSTPAATSSQPSENRAGWSRRGLRKTIEEAAPTPKSSATKHPASSPNTGLSRRPPHCSVCGVLQKEHAQPCDVSHIRL